MEKRILAAAVQSREASNKLSKLLQEKDFSEIGAELFRRVLNYYHVDPEATKVDISLLKSVIEEEMPKQADIVNAVLDDLEDTSVPNLLKEVTKLKKKALSQEIIQALARDPESNQALSLMDTFRDIEDIQEEEVLSVSDYAKEYLTELASQVGLIKIYPKVINDAIDGGILRGSHIVEIGRAHV